MGVFAIGDCQPELNQAAPQVAVPNPTNRDRALVSVVTHSLAVDVPPTNLLLQSTRRRDAALPLRFINVLANLTCFWRIDAMQTDFRVANIKSVPVDNSCFARDASEPIRSGVDDRCVTTQHQGEKEDGFDQPADEDL